MSNRTYHPRGESVHGFAVEDHPFYVVWADMLSRCTNPNNAGYHNYGGRGITVCPRWYHFVNFANDMWPRGEDSLTLDRVDNERGYGPTNCVWSTRSDQCLNRRRFKNNTSGSTGVVSLKGGRFHVRFDYENKRYSVGRFDDIDVATRARDDFVALFFTDRDAATANINVETIWHTSSTKIRGVTPHKDGGYMVRATKNGVRHYLGYFKTVQEAAHARARFIEG